MNIERLNIIRNYLLTPPADAEYGFHMSAYSIESCKSTYSDPGHHCGTLHCIAGLAIEMWGDEYPESQSEMRSHLAAQILDLTRDQRVSLFFAWGHNLEKITREDAAYTICVLIETGEAVWPERLRHSKEAAYD